MNPTLTAERSGLYRTPADTSAVVAAARAGRVTWCDLDVGAVADKAELLARVAAAFRLPAHFGHNWDALADCLQDLPSGSAGSVLRVRDAARAAGALGEDWATFLEILAESADWWKERGRPFVVLVDGAADLPPWT